MGHASKRDLTGHWFPEHISNTSEREKRDGWDPLEHCDLWHCEQAEKSTAVSSNPTSATDLLSDSRHYCFVAHLHQIQSFTSLWWNFIVSDVRNPSCAHLDIKTRGILKITDTRLLDHSSLKCSPHQNANRIFLFGGHRGYTTQCF